MRNLKSLNNLCIIVLLLFPIINYAQLSLDVTTDKFNYESGEVIKLKFSVTNNTNDTIKIAHSSITGSTHFNVTLNGMDISSRGIALDALEYPVYPPHSCRVYQFQLDLKTSGLPNFSGSHTIVATFNSYDVETYDPQEIVDSVKFNADKYKGGNIEIYFSFENDSNLDFYREMYNANIIRRDEFEVFNTITEDWNIVGFEIDNVYQELLLSQYCSSVDIPRGIEFDSLYFEYNVENSNSTVNNIEVGNAYPNPFNPSTFINVRLSEAADVKINLYNMAGEKVKHIFSGLLTDGQVYKFKITADNLPSGVYLFSVSGNNYKKSQKITLIK